MARALVKYFFLRFLCNLHYSRYYVEKPPSPIKYPVSFERISNGKLDASSFAKNKSNSSQRIVPHLPIRNATLSGISSALVSSSLLINTATWRPIKLGRWLTSSFRYVGKRQRHHSLFFYLRQLCCTYLFSFSYVVLLTLFGPILSQ